jgi:hypothetical protein
LSAVRKTFQRAQEIQAILLLILRKAVELLNHTVRFGSVAGEIASALMRLDRAQQVFRSSVMEKTNTLP